VRARPRISASIARTATVVVVLALQSAAIAPLLRCDGPRCAAMSCCAGKAVCPMHAPSGRPQFRSCRAEDDALPGAAPATLSLPRRADAPFLRVRSDALSPASEPSARWRPTKPSVPPPERVA
jgi:hypothetical protein